MFSIFRHAANSVNEECHHQGFLAKFGKHSSRQGLVKNVAVFLEKLYLLGKYAFVQLPDLVIRNLLRNKYHQFCQHYCLC